MARVVYRGPQESYGFLWRDGRAYRFDRDEPQDVPVEIAEYVAGLNPRRLPLQSDEGPVAGDYGGQVFSVVVEGKAGRKAAPTGGEA